MDEARATCAIDISGRPFLRFDAQLPPGGTGGFDHELVEEFFRAVANAARRSRCTSTVEAGTNAHHMIEAAFKAFARALRDGGRDRPDRDRRALDEGDADASDPAIGIVDYGMGNRRSVEKALEHVGARVVPHRATTTRCAPPTALVVPGVGAFPRAMAHPARARPRRARDPSARARATPVLGLCLGMQLLFDARPSSAATAGLGLLPGEVVALEPGAG